MNAAVSPLVDAARLAAELAGDSAPVLLDSRWRLGGPPGAESYLAGHLPGAAFVDLDGDLAGPPGGGGRHPLPDSATFQAAMRRAGVSEGRPVVAYDDGDSIAAARAWWTLRYFGHDQVRVLDGGFSAWVAAGLPVSRSAVSQHLKILKNAGLVEDAAEGTRRIYAADPAGGFAAVVHQSNPTHNLRFGDMLREERRPLHVCSACGAVNAGIS